MGVGISVNITSSQIISFLLPVISLFLIMDTTQLMFPVSVYISHKFFAVFLTSLSRQLNEHYHTCRFDVCTAVHYLYIGQYRSIVTLKNMFTTKQKFSDLRHEHESDTKLSQIEYKSGTFDSGKNMVKHRRITLTYSCSVKGVFIIYNRGWYRREINLIEKNSATQLFC